MRIYYSIDEVISDRRQGKKLYEVVENILNSPHILSQIETPFDILGGLNRGDYVDMSTKTWMSLSVELQIKYATAYQEWYAHHSGHPSIEGTFDLMSGVETKMKLIPPGKYSVGYTYEDNRASKIEKPFWLGKYEVTQREWIAVMPDNPSHFQDDMRKPVERVSWYDCQIFCERTRMRLPHSIEWQYACRAGTTTEYSFGNDETRLEKYGWYKDNSEDETHPVGKKLANAWGLYDMHGNVREWCENKYDSSPHCRVACGGGWEDEAFACCSESRSRLNAGIHVIDVGFRVAKSV